MLRICSGLAGGSDEIAPDCYGPAALSAARRPANPQTCQPINPPAPADPGRLPTVFRLATTDTK
jgi:hypothetical protein